MPAKRYKVTLEPDERGELEKLISRGKGAARRLAHARILLHADQGEGRPGRIDADTYVTTLSYELARLAAGSCCVAVDAVCAGHAQNGLVIVRPPGHHAERYAGIIIQGRP